MKDVVSIIAAKRPDLMIHDVSRPGVVDGNDAAFLVVNVPLREAYLVNGKHRSTQFGLSLGDRVLTSLVCGCCELVVDLERVKELVARHSLMRIYVRKPWAFTTSVNYRYWEEATLTFLEEDVRLLDQPPS